MSIACPGCRGSGGGCDECEGTGLWCVKADLVVDGQNIARRRIPARPGKAPAGLGIPETGVRDA